MKGNYHKKYSENSRNVEGVKVKVSEVNADGEDPIIPGEGNRNFDDPVTPNKEALSDKTIPGKKIKSPKN